MPTHSPSHQVRPDAQRHKGEPVQKGGGPLRLAVLEAAPRVCKLGSVRARAIGPPWMERVRLRIATHG